MKILSNILKSVIAFIVIPPSLFAFVFVGLGEGFLYSMALMLFTLPMTFIVLLLELKKKNIEQ